MELPGKRGRQSDLRLTGHEQTIDQGLTERDVHEDTSPELVQNRPVDRIVAPGETNLVVTRHEKARKEVYRGVSR